MHQAPAVRRACLRCLCLCAARPSDVSLLAPPIRAHASRLLPTSKIMGREGAMTLGELNPLQWRLEGVCVVNARLNDVNEHRGRTQSAGRPLPRHTVRMWKFRSSPKAASPHAAEPVAQPVAQPVDAQPASPPNASYAPPLPDGWAMHSSTQYPGASVPLSLPV